MRPALPVGVSAQLPGEVYIRVVEIRDAAEADWPDIRAFLRPIMAQGATYAWPEDPTDAEDRAAWMERPPGRTVVAVDDRGVVLGSAKMGPNRPGRGSHIATASFLVAPEHSGKGIGRALGEEMISWARAAGYHGVQFNAVVETNTPAVRLWQSLGFEIIGTVPEAFDHPEHGLVGLHVMYLGLLVPVPASDPSLDQSAPSSV